MRKEDVDDLRQKCWNMYIIICKVDDQCKFDVWSQAPKVDVFWNNPEGESGEEGRGGLDVEDMLYTFGKCWYMVKPLQNCKAIVLLIKMN